MSLHRIFLPGTLFFLTVLGACADAGHEPDAKREIHTHFVVRGSGEPVVLVHGFSQTHEAWFETPLYEDLVHDHKLIAVDLRGHGRSSKPHDPIAYGPNLQADLVSLLDHLNIDKAHFVGFSLGASVVGDLLVLSPDRVQTATMGSGYFTTWDEAEEDFARGLEERGASGEHHEPENQDYRALAALIRGARYLPVSPEQISAVSTPTLMVFGSIELEHMTSVQNQRLRELPAAVELKIIDGADHDSPKAAILSPEFVEAVRTLIASNPVN